MSTVRIAVLILVCLIPYSAWANGAPLAAGPFGMAGKSVGGSVTVDSARLMDFVGRKDPITHEIIYSWELVGGAKNVGLTAKIWGTVTAVYHALTGEQWFCVDDGSEVNPDLGDMGVLVYSDADVKQGQFVSVVGTVGVEQSFDSTGRLVRSITTASPADVIVLRDVPALSEWFSDEFDSLELDPRWGRDPLHYGSYSLSTYPGCLTLAGPYFGVYQPAPPEWTVEFSVKLDGVITSPEVDSVMAGLVTSPDSPLTDWVAQVVLRYNGTMPPEKSVYAAGQYVGTLGPENRCWFRCRQTSTRLYVSYSLNGISYSSEVSRSVAAAPGFFRLIAEGFRIPVIARFDYFRVSVPGH